MTAATVGRGRARLAPEPPRLRLNWTGIGVLLGTAGSLGAAVSAYATLTDRVAHLEANVPPGAIQRLDERTLQMQATLNDLKARP